MKRYVIMQQYSSGFTRICVPVFKNKQDAEKFIKSTQTTTGTPIETIHELQEYDL